jgi:hypothetical protein
MLGHFEAHGVARIVPRILCGTYVLRQRGDSKGHPDSTPTGITLNDFVTADAKADKWISPGPEKVIFTRFRDFRRFRL